MRRILTTLLPLCAAGALFSGLFSGAGAQNGTQAQPGDPPVAALISISAPDEDGVVTINGAAGAVFPAAEVVIRNLYTEETVSVLAGVTGSFTARLFGPGNTPFWISPGRDIPNNVTAARGSLPGGPGTILYGSAPDTAQNRPPVTALVIDGDLTDWAAYPNARLLPGDAYGLLNNDSFYAAFELPEVPSDYDVMRMTFSLDGAVYALTFDPRVLQAAALRRLDPNPNDLPPLPAAIALRENILEVRFRWGRINVNNPTIETVTLESLEVLGTAPSEGEAPVLASVTAEQAALIVTEDDGIVRLNSPLPQEGLTRFTIAGPLGNGAGRWSARGRTGSLNLQAGDQLLIELDVTLRTATMPDDFTALQIGGEVWLQRVIDAEGLQSAGGLNSNNGLSRVFTASRMPIDNYNSDIYLGEVTIPPQRLVGEGDRLQFPLDLAFELPADLPAGIYVPVFRGFAQPEDAARSYWYEAGLFGNGTGLSRVPITRLPLTLGVGGATGGRLVFSLFQDNPSEGSRGLLSDEDQANFALSNRTRYNSATYILPPGTYPLEPYLLNQMPNAYDSTAAPLIPFFFPGGRLSAEVRLPSGQTASLGNAPIVQNRLSTATIDERTLFGAQSPVDVYRLTTYNPAFTGFAFTEYGEHTITLTGGLEDVYGNRYDGGGTYHLLIAELLDLTPGVLPGTPFSVGDVFNPSVTLAPAVAADVTVTVRFYPIDGGQFETVYEGQANAFGYFHPGSEAEALRFTMPGEYVVDYEARFTDGEGRLWAASMRSAGVVASGNGTLIAHGQRGLIERYDRYPPAWFNTTRYPTNANLIRPIVNMPYHSGDIAWIADGAQSGLNPIMTVQDVAGIYTNRLLQTADAAPIGGVSLAEAARVDALPIRWNPNSSYSYISVDRPGLTVRQFVQGGDDPALNVYFDADDPHNGQLGAGPRGLLPGDYVFLFGGVVVRDQASGVFDTAGYAALATIIDPRSGDTLGARVYPPLRGADGGADGGSLLVVRNTPVDAFVHLTGVQPGQVLIEGDTLAIAGQVAPTLSAVVTVAITSPSGVVHVFDVQSNGTGYFYDPDQNFAVDETGIWTVRITAQVGGRTSAGVGQPPLPTGGVLGTVENSFPIYVVESNISTINPSNGLEMVDEIQAATPLNLNIALPIGWTAYQASATVTMPGYFMRTESLSIGSQSFGFQYNAGQLAREFPNLETDGRPRGPAGSDVVTVTLVVTGLDSSGNPQIRARVFTVMHDRLLAPE